MAVRTIVNDDEALVGSIVAERYHVRDVLGQGSTGTVFGTEHLSFGRQAAMKVLRPRHVSLEAVRHVFEGDTRVALAISHPSLCEVFDLGTLPDGAPFFVMERLEGETLAARLGRERFSAAAAVDLMMQLLAAVDAVHEHAYLLRDLRPQNVFLAHRRGCRPIVKVLDVGLARLLPLERVEAEWNALRAAPPGSVGAAGLLSLPHYLAPERARAGDHGLEPASDLFAAGVILYEALTGQRPFMARTWAALAQQIASTPPPPLATLRPDLPPALGALVARALAPDPRERPSSARLFQDDLRAVFEGGRRPASTPLRAPARDQPAPEADEETRTDRRAADLTVNTALDSRPLRAAAPWVPAAATAIDVEIDVDLEEPAATARGTELDATLDVAFPDRGAPRSEDDETATTPLNPALRARIEQLARGTAPVAPAPSRPPPAHPIRPPRQR